MQKFLSWTPLLLVLTAIFPLQAEEVSSIQRLMIQDLEVAKYNISVKYAPKAWKNEYCAWDLNEATEKARARILNEKPNTPRDYQKIFSQFMASMHDYHVHPIYVSTSWSMFPIQVRGVNGRYFFTQLNNDFTLGLEEAGFLSIDQSTLDMISNNFKGIALGDEILSVNGQPIREFLEQLIDENFYGDRSPTGYAIAERNLFLRLGKKGHEIPTGTFELTILHEGDKKPFTVTLPWIHVREWVSNHVLKDVYEKKAALAYSDSSKNPKTQRPLETIDRLLAKDFSVDIAKDLAPRNLDHMIPDLKMELRTPKEKSKDERVKGTLPPLGRIIWESNIDEGIYAYLYQHVSGHRIGYFYLASFDASGSEADTLIQELCKAVKVFNHRADALVVDITNNTGGNLMFMYAVLAILTDSPLKVPSHQELIIQEDVLKAAVLYTTLKNYEPAEQESEEQETLSGYTVTTKLIEQVLNYASMIIQTWESGERLTDPLYLFGIDEVMPHPTTRFKKPIMVLTNEYNFSCADFFPAILQDNKRAVIFGKQTAGAGGYVKNYPLSSCFGVQGIRLTASIGYRLDGQPIENLGVSPDIPYELTLNDLKRNYVDYIRRLNLEIKKLIINSNAK